MAHAEEFRPRAQALKGDALIALSRIPTGMASTDYLYWAGPVRRFVSQPAVASLPRPVEASVDHHTEGGRRCFTAEPTPPVQSVTLQLSEDHELL